MMEGGGGGGGGAQSWCFTEWQTHREDRISHILWHNLSEMKCSRTCDSLLVFMSVRHVTFNVWRDWGRGAGWLGGGGGGGGGGVNLNEPGKQRYGKQKLPTAGEPPKMML